MAQFASDSFTGTEGTELATYSSSWAKAPSLTGNAEIVSNAVRASSTTSASYYHSGTPGSADYEVNADWTRPSSATYDNQIGVTARQSTSANTLYRLSVRPSSVNENQAQLFRFVSGTATQLGSNTTLSGGTGTYNLKLRVEGDQISGYWNGSSTAFIDVTDASPITAAGKAGIRTFSGTTPTDNNAPRLDNFSADDIAAAGAYTLTASLYTNTNTLYVPVVSVGAVTLSPSLYTNTNSFYGPVVSPSYSITPDLYTNSQSYYSPVVSTTYSIIPGLYTNNQSFFTHLIEVAGGGQNLLPSLYTNTNSFYNASVTVGSVTLAPSLYTNTNSFYSIEVTSSYLLQPSLVVNTNEFYSPEVTQGVGGVQELTPSLFINDNTFYIHVLTGGETVVLGAGGRRKKKKKQYLVDGVLRELDDGEVQQLLADAQQQLQREAKKLKEEKLEVPLEEVTEVLEKTIFKEEVLEEVVKPSKKATPRVQEEVEVTVTPVEAKEDDNDDEEALQLLAVYDNKRDEVRKMVKGMIEGLIRDASRTH